MTEVEKMPAKKAKLGLFQGYGIELEYMIVDKDTLNVLPITDSVFYAVSGSYPLEIERGDISWSNELAAHVLELKTNGPAKTLNGLEQLFQAHVCHLNEILKFYNAMFLPTAMHPWMDPFKEMKLWPHEQNPIYEAYNRIFNCQGHGWANLQSTHINLPFANDDEFAKLHAAIRILLPIMPSISASSPFVDGRLTNCLDSRLQAYMDNSKIIPSITGKVIPEIVCSRAEYESEILAPMYRDIAPYDPDIILQEEWLNSRGAIARFERYAIEIRTLDIQECPSADIAIAKAIVRVLKDIIDEKYADFELVQQYDLHKLHQIFLDSTIHGEKSVISFKDYLQLFGIQKERCTTQELWQSILEKSISKGEYGTTTDSLKTILQEGTLATRIKRAWLKNPKHENLKEIYRELADCLMLGKMYI